MTAKCMSEQTMGWCELRRGCWIESPVKLPLIKRERKAVRLVGTMRRLRRVGFAGVGLLLALALPQGLRADAGVLIPKDKEAPDAAVLSLAEMKVEIAIDNGDA